MFRRYRHEDPFRKIRSFLAFILIAIGVIALLYLMDFIHAFFIDEWYFSIITAVVTVVAGLLMLVSGGYHRYY